MSRNKERKKKIEGRKRNHDLKKTRGRSKEDKEEIETGGRGGERGSSRRQDKRKIK